MKTKTAIKTKAAILYQAGEPLVIEEGLEIPELKPEQVLVKLEYAGLCRSQLMEARGHRGEDKYLPHLLGHEATGTVVEVGSEVTKVKSGDEVILGWIKGEGKESGGSAYKKDDITINAGNVTTLSEYSVVSENRCTLLPAGVSKDIGILFGCAIPTGAGMVINQLNPKANSSIAVFGLGGIGISALIASKLYNPSQLIAVDVEDFKLDFARELGATHTINSKKEDVAKVISDLTSGVGVDYSVEASGFAKTIELAFKAVRNGGGYCLFATHPKHGDSIQLDPYDLICGKRIEGSWGGNSRPDEDIPKIAELYLKEKLPFEKLLSKPYSLDQVNEALNDLENQKVMRVLIKLDRGKEV